MADGSTPQEHSRPKGPCFFWPGGSFRSPSDAYDSVRLPWAARCADAAGAGVLRTPVAARAGARRRKLACAQVSPISSRSSVKVSDQKREQLLRGAGVEWVAVQTEGPGLEFGARQGKRTSQQAPYFVDLRGQAPTAWLAAPFQTLFGGSRAAACGSAPSRGSISADFIEIVAPDAEFEDAELLELLLAHGADRGAGGLQDGCGRGWGLSVAGTSSWSGPCSGSPTQWSGSGPTLEDGEAQGAALRPGRDEIGRAEAESFDRMQGGPAHRALNSRARLAALGEAVAKINHDLKNMLTSAQIASGNGLAALKDPKVSQALPRAGARARSGRGSWPPACWPTARLQEAAPRRPATCRWPRPSKRRLKRPGWPEQGVAAGAQDRGVRAGQRRPRPAAPGSSPTYCATPDRRSRHPKKDMAGVPGRIEVSLAFGRKTPASSSGGRQRPRRARSACRERLFQPFAGSGRPDGAGPRPGDRPRAWRARPRRRPDAGRDLREGVEVRGPPARRPAPRAAAARGEERRLTSSPWPRLRGADRRRRAGRSV